MNSTPHSHSLNAVCMLLCVVTILRCFSPVQLLPLVPGVTVPPGVRISPTTFCMRAKIKGHAKYLKNFWKKNEMET